MSNQLTVFARTDERWGLRNHVLILPLHSALSATARRIADESDGAVAVSHDWSGEVDGDFDRIIKTFSGFAANPNNYATVFITIGTPGELLIIDLAELPILNKGKGNKLIQLDEKEQIISMTTLNLDEIIQVAAGQQHLKLKGDDLQKYIGKRATKGQLLPRGYQKANRLLIQR